MDKVNKQRNINLITSRILISRGASVARYFATQQHRSPKCGQRSIAFAIAASACWDKDVSINGIEIGIPVNSSVITEEIEQLN